jgi:ABC-type proline/glycine betaine transport system permease subunit
MAERCAGAPVEEFQQLSSPIVNFLVPFFSRVAKPWEAGLIALLFALLVAAMVLAWRDHWKWSYALFTVTILLSIYWFDYHATSQLTIQL